MSFYLLCLGLTALGWTSRAQGEEESSSSKCSQNAVVMAMTRCQGERHHLSLASQTNNTQLLCRALQQYADCMQPRIRGCQGPAKMAFDVITGKYSAPPFNCRLTDAEDSSTFARENYRSNDASPPYVKTHVPVDQEVLDKRPKDLQSTTLGEKEEAPDSAVEPLTPSSTNHQSTNQLGYITDNKVQEEDEEKETETKRQSTAVHRSSEDSPVVLTPSTPEPTASQDTSGRGAIRTGTGNRSSRLETAYWFLLVSSILVLVSH